MFQDDPKDNVLPYMNDNNEYTSMVASYRNMFTICLSVGPASETPNHINYRVVLFHTPDIGLINL